MPGREDFEERRQARIDRLNEASEKAAKRSLSYNKLSSDLVQDIPLGQPNIVGRPALPRLREKSARAMDKAIEESDKADYYSNRAEAAENNSTISSDDPAAIEKLQAKIAKLETERERIKTLNKAARKNGTEPEPWFTLPYIGRDIKAAKERIAKLEAIDAMPAELIEFDSGEIESDLETNRIIIRYDERQPEEITEKLKGNGFHWSPTEHAWLRLRSRAALRMACAICGVEPIRKDEPICRACAEKIAARLAAGTQGSGEVGSGEAPHAG